MPLPNKLLMSWDGTDQGRLIYVPVEIHHLGFIGSR